VVDATGWISYSARLAAGRSGVPLILSARDFGFTCPTRTLVRCGRVCSGPGRKKCLRHAAANYGPPKGLAAATGVLGLRRWLLAGSAGVHVASRFVADIEKRDFIGNSSHRMVLVPDMVRPDTDEEVVTALDDAAGRLLDRLPAEPFILFVGALQLHKGLAPLLASHAALRNPPPLVVVGTSWPDSPKSWPAGVTALTDVPNPVVRRIWDRALFGVAPSLVPETFGNVVLEAMWHSRAMIASAIGGPLDTVADGETGFLVPPGDVAALTEAMQKLADDAALRDRMGAAARKRVAARFVPSVVIPEFERLYAEAAAGTQRR
jgi:glycosyltransferase involved in cell wall biosynthesis